MIPLLSFRLSILARFRARLFLPSPCRLVFVSLEEMEDVFIHYLYIFIFIQDMKLRRERLRERRCHKERRTELSVAGFLLLVDVS